MLQNKVDVNGDGHCYPCMGCRSFLTPYLDDGGNPKYYGRFNQGVVTINLPDVGLSAVKQMEGITYIDDEQYQKRKEEIFWTIFEERLELCHRALRLRHERLLGTLSDASPIHWQNGGLARLKKGETIDKLLYGGYSTLSLGYAGLYECVKLIWKCPNCGNTNRTKMNIARRTCGYIGVNDFNQGRTQEIKERYVHLGGK